MTPAVAKTCGPGRPKDLEKRAAILDAAKRLFPLSGFEGTSMDAIAAEAGVSKLTVYSHYTDKETLFFAAIRARCTEQMPETLFEVDVDGPARRQLEAIAHAFFALIAAPEAVALHRLLTSGSGSSQKLAQMFWEAGPQRVQEGFEGFLRQGNRGRPARHRRCSAARRGSSSPCSRAICTRACCAAAPRWSSAQEVDAHVRATVDFFLRACAPRPSRVVSP